MIEDIKCRNTMCLICESYRSFKDCDGCIEEGANLNDEKTYKNFKLKSCYMRTKCHHADCKFNANYNTRAISSRFDLESIASKQSEKLMRFEKFTGYSIDDFLSLYLSGKLRLRVENNKTKNMKYVFVIQKLISAFSSSGEVIQDGIYDIHRKHHMKDLYWDIIDNNEYDTEIKIEKITKTESEYADTYTVDVSIYTRIDRKDGKNG